MSDELEREFRDERRQVAPLSFVTGFCVGLATGLAIATACALVVVSVLS